MCGVGGVASGGEGRVGRGGVHGSRIIATSLRCGNRDPAALGAAGYDVPACHAYLSGPSGGDCMNFGCAVRRACPVSQGYARLAEHSAYHMGTFHT